MTTTTGAAPAPTFVPDLVGPYVVELRVADAIGSGAPDAVTVKHADGQSLKIPLWMLQPDAADFRLREQVELPASVLLALVDRLPALRCAGTSPQSGTP